MRTYCNVLLLEKDGGFSQEEIAVLPRISSWAIMPGTEGKQDGTLSPLEKRQYGLKVKRILDYGRLAFIEASQHDLKITAKQYCDPIKESPECLLIGAVKQVKP